jgi:hypothetical protein
MNIETTITKKSGNDRVRACRVFNVNRKKFSTKEIPDAVVKPTGENIYVMGRYERQPEARCCPPPQSRWRIG